jgi:prevent-host-death family protein
MKHTRSISKSQFKAKALEYFRAVETQRKPLVITDRGKPVLKIVPYTDSSEDLLKEFRGTVVKYDDPTGPIGDSDWEALR